NAFSLAYTISRFYGDLPMSSSPDPYARIWRKPPRGYLGVAHLGYSYTNAERRLYGIGPERGFTLSLGVDIADRPLASEYSLYVFAYSARKYFPMPWLRHHTLALSASGAISTGDYPR